MMPARVQTGCLELGNSRRTSVNDCLYVILDSCRYDSLVAAQTPVLDAFCDACDAVVERRYSYASWTSPAHYAFLMGMVPHQSPRGVFASEVYKNDFAKWVDRLGVSGLSFRSFLPHLSLPKVLREIGYRTVARVSMPVLNRSTSISMYFDDYRLMEDHNDFSGMVRDLAFADSFPTFCFLNIGETHYPYMLKEDELPHISGVHGVFKHMDDLVVRYGDPGETGSGEFFAKEMLETLQMQQIRSVEYIDGVFRDLFLKVPAGTHVIVTADHGELFGEDGYFGHGPIMHEKCFEVPFLEGKVTEELKRTLEEFPTR